MKIKYNSEILTGGLFLLLGAVLWFLIPTQIETLETGTITAQTFPQIAVLGMILCSLGLLIQGLRKEKKAVCLDAHWLRNPQVHKELRSVLFCLLLVLYSLLFSVVGFVVDTVALVVCILLYYRSRKILHYGIAVLTVAVVYAVFTYGLNVNLPTFFGIG